MNTTSYQQGLGPQQYMPQQVAPLPQEQQQIKFYKSGLFGLSSAPGRLERDASRMQQDGWRLQFADTWVPIKERYDGGLSAPSSTQAPSDRFRNVRNWTLIIVTNLISFVCMYFVLSGAHIQPDLVKSVT